MMSLLNKIFIFSLIGIIIVAGILYFNTKSIPTKLEDHKEEYSRPLDYEAFENIACKALVLEDLKICQSIENLQAEDVLKKRESDRCFRLYNMNLAIKNKDVTKCDFFLGDDNVFNLCKGFITMDTSNNPLVSKENDFMWKIFKHQKDIKIPENNKDEKELLDVYYYMLAIYDKDISLCNKIGGTPVSNRTSVECKAIVSQDPSICNSFEISSKTTH